VRRSEMNIEGARGRELDERNEERERDGGGNRDGEREERQNWMRGTISGDAVKRLGSVRNQKQIYVDNETQSNRR
jgi:hypothetical protein